MLFIGTYKKKPIMLYINNLGRDNLFSFFFLLRDKDRQAANEKSTPRRVYIKEKSGGLVGGESCEKGCCGWGLGARERDLPAKPINLLEGMYGGDVTRLDLDKALFFFF